MSDKEERKETNTKEKNYKQSKNNKKGKNNNKHQDQDSNQTKSKQQLQFPNTTQPQIQPLYPSQNPPPNPFLNSLTNQPKKNQLENNFLFQQGNPIPTPMQTQPQNPQNIFPNQQQNNIVYPQLNQQNNQITYSTNNPMTNLNQKNMLDQNCSNNHGQYKCYCNHNHSGNVTDVEDVNMMEEEKMNGVENNGLLQKKILVDKQLLKMKVAQEYTNDMLGRALSKVEHYSSRYGKQNIDNKKFNYYNRFDNGFNKEKDNLITSLINALDTLQDYYEEDGKNKIFPENFKQGNIIKYIKNLRDNCFENDPNRKYFNDFIKIISGKKVNFANLFNTQNAKVDPNILITSGISTMKYVERQEKQWKEKAEKEGDYPIMLNVGMDWDNNKNIPDSLKYSGGII